MNLWAMEAKVMECSRCGGFHESALIKELVNKFVVDETETATHYKFVQIGEKDDGSPIEEPMIVTPETEGAIEFKKPMVIELEDNQKNQYGGWGWCPKNEEPLFFHMVITVKKEGEDDTSKES